MPIIDCYLFSNSPNYILRVINYIDYICICKNEEKEEEEGEEMKEKRGTLRIWKSKRWESGKCSVCKHNILEIFYGSTYSITKSPSNNKNLTTKLPKPHFTFVGFLIPNVKPQTSSCLSSSSLNYIVCIIKL